MYHRHGTSQGMCKYCNKHFHVTPDHTTFCDINCMLKYRKGFIFGKETRKYKPGEDYRAKHPKFFNSDGSGLSKSNRIALSRLKAARQRSMDG